MAWAQICSEALVPTVVNAEQHQRFSFQLQRPSWFGDAWWKLWTDLVDSAKQIKPAKTSYLSFPPLSPILSSLSLCLVGLLVFFFMRA